ncbi:MAG: hypothetical protein J7M19_07595 [Planctomycetes bacterium]|nr:hypothetical protein [Planctomycetota bacterium]
MRVFTTAAVILCGLLTAFSPAAEEPAGALGPADIIMRAKSALAAAGNIEAEVDLDVNYPTHYSSHIKILASPTGDERSQMTTTINENTFSSLTVISKGVLWTQQSTPVGLVVTTIDINKVKKALRETGEEFAALPVLGTNLLFDLGNLAKIIKFDAADESTLESRKVRVISGRLRSAFEKGKMQLPLGAARYYSSVKVYLDSQDFLLRRIELGEEKGRPLVVLDFKMIEKNVEIPEGTFKYAPPEDTQVIDRTEWAIRQMKGE